MSINFLNNTQNDYFCIIDPLQFEKFSDLQNIINNDSVTNTLSSTIFEVISKGISSSVIQTKLGDIMSTIGTISSTILAQNGIAQDTASFYKFRINPQKMRVSRRKMIDEKFTGAGWDLDTISEEMIVYNFEGTTGSLVPYNLSNTILEPALRTIISEYGGGGIIGSLLDSNIPILTNNPKLSASYIKFLNFQNFWKNNNNDLLFVWEDNCYVGKFVDFSFNVSEKEPYQIMWSFSVKVYPDFVYNMYNGWITEENYDTIQHTFNTRFKDIDLNKESNPLTEKYDKEKSSSILTQIEQESLQWLSDLGKSLYNKNLNSYKTAQLQNANTNLSKINPRELAEQYKQFSKIDLFEDSLSFKLVNSIKEIDVGSTNTNTTGGTVNEIKETDIIENIPQNP